MIEKKLTFYRICEPNCSLIATVEDGAISALAPNRDHPSGGVACHKGLSFLDVHNDPDRLDQPIRRANPKSEEKGDFVATDWDSAMSDIGERLAKIRDIHGPNAIAIYTGNAFACGNISALFSLAAVQATIGTRMLFSANTQDTQNKMIGAAYIYGSMGVGFVPDIRSTDYLLCLGSNPRVSRWTYVSVPNDDLRMLTEVRERGGKIRFVNPRRIESSTDETGPTLRIKPGTDAYFLAALLNEIDQIGGFDSKLVDAYGKNFDGLRTFIADYTPLRVAQVTGISEAEIKEIALEIVSAPSAAVYMATGLNQSRQGVICYWLVEMINFLTGNLGRKGGTYRPSALIEQFDPFTGMVPLETSIGTLATPDPPGYCKLPAAALSSLIENGDIKALLVFGGNPVLTVGGEKKLREACLRLDLMVSIDLYRQATGELSDYILPSTDFLEHPDVSLVPNGFQVFPHTLYTDAVVDPKGDRRDGWWIMNRLTQAMGLPSALDENPQATYAADLMAGLLAARGQTIESMRELPHQTLLIEQEPYELLFEKCLVHPDKRIDCCPTAFLESGLLTRFDEIFTELEAEGDDQLKMISLRTRYMHNSWLTNSAKHRRGMQSTNPLHISSVDASARDLFDGDLVEVFNAQGSIKAVVLIDDDLRPGVVAMTHGFGNHSSFGVSVANRKPGANSNALLPIEVENIEPLSHMSWMTAVPVEVVSATNTSLPKCDHKEHCGNKWRYRDNED